MKRCIFKLNACLVLVVAISMTILLNSNVRADDDVVDVINITVPAACTLETTSGTGETYNVSLMPAQYEDDIGPTPISVFCNTSGGFSIYAIGFSNDEYGNTKMLTSNPSTYFDTGTNTSGATSSWAMKLEAVAGSGTGVYTPTVVSPFTSYANVPTSYAKVATVASASTNNIEASLRAYYAVYVSPTQPAGAYTGKVRYTIVNPSSNVPNEPKSTAGGYIGYYPNAGNTVVDTMSDTTQTISASATSATLWASNFKRPGYGFAGWSDAFDYVANVGSESNPNAHIYGPNETIEFAAGQYSSTNGGLSLYAVWVPSAGSLQSWTCPSDSVMPIGNVTALTDQRDNDTYAVAKLADGKCWMIENLRLDYTNSDNSTGSLSQGYGGQFVGLAQPETANFTATNNSATDPTEPNSLYYAGTGNQGNLGATIDILQQNYAGSRMPRYRNDNTNTNSTINPNTTVANMTGTWQNVYSYGNYYTWAAALANTNHYSNPTATDANNKTSETANTSLCPTGWKLPRGGVKTRIEGGTSDLYALGLAIVGTAPANYSSSTIPYWTDNSNTEGTDASKAMRTYPNNFLYSGYAYGSSVNNRSWFGYYWSSTAGSYLLSLDSSRVHPGTYSSNKYYGYSIRCLVGS